jgi:hypothetical protein
MALTGRCLCGSVRYEVDGELAPLFNCHCRFCRRAHGAAFSTISFLPGEQFRVVEGAELIQGFETPGVGIRSFCSRCGTRLFNQAWDNRDSFGVVIATLDEEPAQGPVCHLNVESKAGWYEILDDLPRFDGFPPGSGMD